MTLAFFNGVAEGKMQTPEGLTAAANMNPYHDKDGKCTQRALAQQKRGEAAMSAVIARKIDVAEAMHRPELGLVDFRYGQAGDPAQDHAGGHGIAKVVGKHGEEVALRLPAVIAHGAITRGATRAMIDHQGMRAVLANNWTGAASNHWVVTRYEEKEGSSR